MGVLHSLRGCDLLLRTIGRKIPSLIIELKMWLHEVKRLGRTNLL